MAWIQPLAFQRLSAPFNAQAQTPEETNQRQPKIAHNYSVKWISHALIDIHFHHLIAQCRGNYPQAKTSREQPEEEEKSANHIVCAH